MANCVCEVFLTLESFHTAIEALDTTQFLHAFTFREAGTRLEKIVLIRTE